MIGLGTQDNLAYAKKFYARVKFTATHMLWDKSGKSWSDLGVPGQPAWLLLNRAGEIVASDTGSIPYDDVLAQANGK